MATAERICEAMRIGTSISSPGSPERDGCRTLRALDERCPEHAVDAGSETDIRGVVVFVGNTV